MTGLHSRLPDPVRSRLRAAVAAVDSALSQPSPGGAARAHLEAAWHELVELLALGPEPAYRDCPVCGATGMRDATVCGYCWTKLRPVGPTAPCGRESSTIRGSS